MRLLLLGGPRFLGRAVTDAALAGGHEVTFFNRGTTNPELYPEVERIVGDRATDLDGLRGRSWDAVVDTCAFVPREVREVADTIGDDVGHYTFVSSLSVHDEDLPAGATEEAATFGPPFPETEEVTEETYGPLKVACEVEAKGRFAGRLLVIRPGYIVGPNDPTDRFTYWVRRAAAGGEMLAGAPPDAEIQGIDARDLGTFVLDRVEASDVDTYGVVGPGEPATWGQAFDAARDAGNADTTIEWADDRWVRDLGPEHERWFPMWHPQLPGFHTYDPSKATAAGLRPRPFDRTIAETLEWDRARGFPPLKAGMTAEKERELLDAWRASAG